MDCHVYYTSALTKKLRQVFVQDAESAEQAVNDVAQLLVAEDEEYQKPMLALIVGGKV